MAKAHPGPTITPAFRVFLPPWVARQPWYRGSGAPSLALVGSFRMEDPAGQVGMETQLLSDGAVVYQVPMTYRGAPLPGAAPAALIVTAEHSELGTRWIYDAEADPVWRDELLRLVRDGAAADLGTRDGKVRDAVRGVPLDEARLGAGELAIEVRRVLAPGEAAGETPAGGAGETPAGGTGVAGLVSGTWRPGAPGAPPVSGCLAVVRAMT